MIRLHTPGFKDAGNRALPIFNRGQGDIARAARCLNQLRAERDAGRQRISSEIGRAALNLETARKQVEFYETSCCLRASACDSLGSSHIKWTDRIAFGD